MKASLGKGFLWPLAALIFLGAGGCNGSGDGFDPLARAKIHTKGRVGDLDKMVDDFAAKRGFIVKRGGFPNEDNRWVDNFSVYTDTNEKTFLSFDNFKVATTFQGAVYSNEGEKKWKDLWQAFLTSSSKEFADDNVEIVKGPVFEFDGQCLLEISGRTYISGTCVVKSEDSAEFSAEGVGPSQAEGYRFEITTAHGVTTGAWNGAFGSRGNDAALGTLTRSGPCWLGNSGNKICVFYPMLDLHCDAGDRRCHWNIKQQTPNQREK